jgi:hypothetical protein
MGVVVGQARDQLHLSQVLDCIWDVWRILLLPGLPSHVIHVQLDICAEHTALVTPALDAGMQGSCVLVYAGAPSVLGTHTPVASGAAVREQGQRQAGCSHFSTKPISV